MKLHLNQSACPYLRIAVQSIICFAVLGTGPSCAQKPDVEWLAEVKTYDSVSAEDGDSRATIAKATKKHVVHSTVRGSGAKAAGIRSKMPISGSRQHPRDPGIETGSVEVINSVSSQGTAPIAPVSSTVPAGPLDASSTAGRFCLNIKPQVEEMRIVFQKKTLFEIEAELDKRLKLLELKITEYKQWLQRRQDFSSKAQDALVKIYAKMRPDAAAQQLASADTETAAALLMKLDPRVASAILNDMEPKLAATLAAVITGAAQTKNDADKPAETAP